MRGNRYRVRLENFQERRLVLRRPMRALQPWGKQRVHAKFDQTSRPSRTPLILAGRSRNPSGSTPKTRPRRRRHFPATGEGPLVRHIEILSQGTRGEEAVHSFY